MNKHLKQQRNFWSSGEAADNILTQKPTAGLTLQNIKTHTMGDRIDTVYLKRPSVSEERKMSDR